MDTTAGTNSRNSSIQYQSVASRSASRSIPARLVATISRKNGCHEKSGASAGWSTRVASQSACALVSANHPAENCRSYTQTFRSLIISYNIVFIYYHISDRWEYKKFNNAAPVACKDFRGFLYPQCLSAPQTIYCT